MAICKLASPVFMASRRSDIVKSHAYISHCASRKAKFARVKFIRLHDIHILHVAIRIPYALVTVHRLRLMDYERTALLL